MPDNAPTWTFIDTARREWVKTALVASTAFLAIWNYRLSARLADADVRLKEQETIGLRLDQELKPLTRDLLKQQVTAESFSNQLAPLRQTLTNHDIRAQELENELAPLKTRVVELEARKEEANAALAEFEAKRAGSQILQIKPAVEESQSIGDIREITLETIFTNAGTLPVTVSELQIEVYEARPSQRAWEPLSKTLQLEYLRGKLFIDPYSSDFEQDPQKRAEFQQQYDELHQDCPHGRLFAIDASSVDVDWTLLESLSRHIAINAELPSGASAFNRFTYLLTEMPNQHHRQWFRFVVTVNPDNEETRSKFEFVVSGLPLKSDNQVTVRNVTETSVRRWAPVVPLLPSNPK